MTSIYESWTTLNLSGGTVSSVMADINIFRCRVIVGESTQEEMKALTH